MKKVLSIIAILLLGTTVSVAGVVRDIETEDTIKHLNVPLVKAMGENIKNIQFRLVLSKDFNASVSGGKNIYYMSGLILGVDTASQFLSVSAHELGHIKSRHLDQLASSIKNSKSVQAGALVLGVLGYLATKNSDGAFATMMLGGQVAERGLLSNIRANEIEADYIALDLFKKAKISPIGQIEVNNMMLKKYGYSAKGATYSRTHPATEDRLEVAKKGLEDSPYKDKQYSVKNEKKFKRMQAKLFGYTSSKNVVFKRYPESDITDLARYSRSMYYLSHSKGKRGVIEIKELIKKYPKDPYYLEGYANLLYSAGELDKAITTYKKALKIYPKAGLMWIEYARYNIEKGDKKSLKEAEYALFRAKQYESSESYLYRIMIALYSKTNEKGKRLLARAEQFYLMGDEKALSIAQQANKNLQKNSAEYKRSEDIIYLLSNGK